MRKAAGYPVAGPCPFELQFNNAIQGKVDGKRGQGHGEQHFIGRWIDETDKHPDNGIKVAVSDMREKGHDPVYTPSAVPVEDFLKQ